MQEAWDRELHFWLHRFLSKVEKHLSICRAAAFLGGRGAGERAQDEALAPCTEARLPLPGWGAPLPAGLYAADAVPGTGKVVSMRVRNLSNCLYSEQGNRFKVPLSWGPAETRCRAQAGDTGGEARAWDSCGKTHQ